MNHWGKKGEGGRKLNDRSIPFKWKGKFDSNRRCFVIIMKLRELLTSSIRTVHDLARDLIAAAADGDMKLLFKWLREGADVNWQDKDGLSAIMKASIYGKIETYKSLLEEKSDINLIDKSGADCVMLAATSGHKECLLELLKAKGNINTVNNIGRSALMCASAANRGECVKILHEAKANIDIQAKNGWTALMYACEYGYPSISLYLLEQKADVNLQTKTSCVGHFPKTALSIAAGAKHEFAKMVYDKVYELVDDSEEYSD